MDRDLDVLTDAPSFTWRRVWLTLLLSAAILGGASFLVRAYPNSGQQAGYDAAIGRDADWVISEVDETGTALPLCDELHAESEESPSEPRYEYESFIRGCGEAVDHTYGRHVPMLPVQ